MSLGEIDEHRVQKVTERSAEGLPWSRYHNELQWPGFIASCFFGIVLGPSRLSKKGEMIQKVSCGAFRECSD